MTHTPWSDVPHHPAPESLDRPPRERGTLKSPIRGLLIAPLVAPVAYWVWAIARAWAGGRSLDWRETLRELVTVAAFGLPVAYAAALLWGAPVLYALHLLRWLRGSTVIAAGACGGALVSIWLTYEQRGAFISAPMPLAEGVLIGALAGGACWWAARR